MTRTKPLDIHTHNALVMALSPLLMVVPFLLAGGAGIGTLAFFLGAILIGICLGGGGDRRIVPLSAQRGFDLSIGFALLGMAVASGLLGGGPAMTVFLTAFGATLLSLSTVTRYTARLS